MLNNRYSYTICLYYFRFFLSLLILRTFCYKGTLIRQQKAGLFTQVFHCWVFLYVYIQ